MTQEEYIAWKEQRELEQEREYDRQIACWDIIDNVEPYPRKD